MSVVGPCDIATSLNTHTHQSTHLPLKHETSPSRNVTNALWSSLFLEEKGQRRKAACLLPEPHLDPPSYNATFNHASFDLA